MRTLTDQDALAIARVLDQVHRRRAARLAAEQDDARRNDAADDHGNDHTVQDGADDDAA